MIFKTHLKIEFLTQNYPSKYTLKLAEKEICIKTSC